MLVELASQRFAESLTCLFPKTSMRRTAQPQDYRSYIPALLPEHAFDAATRYEFRRLNSFF